MTPTTKWMIVHEVGSHIEPAWFDGITNDPITHDTAEAADTELEESLRDFDTACDADWYVWKRGQSK